MDVGTITMCLGDPDHCAREKERIQPLTPATYEVCESHVVLERWSWAADERTSSWLDVAMQS